MTGGKRTILRATFAAMAGLGALLVNDVSLIGSASFVTNAEARIGRPLTPMSYAGVARRTTRRAYGAAAYGAAAYGAAAGAAYGAAVGSGCVQVVDVYGRLITQCY